MANEETPAGFLSRWSRRKADVRQGVVLDDLEKGANKQNQNAPKNPVSTGPNIAPNNGKPSLPPVDVQAGHAVETKTTDNGEGQQKHAPSMADVQSLTKDSDYTQFMAKEVAPEVKNAAMKKLFADPHFNVMDRMDIYIDDYGQSDPIPPAMLRQMVGAKFLNLFDDEDQIKDANAKLNDILAEEDPKVVAQSVPASPNSNTDPLLPNDHTDLRLQPDPASRPEGAGSKPV